MAGDKVYLNRPLNIPTDANFRVLIQSLTETSEVFHETPREYRRTFSLTLELTYSSKSGDYDKDEEELELFIEQVETLVEHDEKLNNNAIKKALSLPEDFCVSDSMFDGIEYRTEVEGELPVYIACLKYDFIYYVQTGIGDGDLTDLDLIRSEINQDGESVDSETSFK